jgi:hypothetical protein
MDPGEICHGDVGCNEGYDASVTASVLAVPRRTNSYIIER